MRDAPHDGIFALIRRISVRSSLLRASDQPKCRYHTRWSAIHCNTARGWTMSAWVAGQARKIGSRWND